MAFRDDRDALRARKEQLEQDLASAKQELDRHERKDANDERELARLRGEVDRLRKAVGELPPPVPTNRAPMIAALAAGLVMLSGVAAFFVAMRADEPTVVVSPGEPLTSLTPPPPPPPPPPATPVRFAAVITSSESRPELPVGAGCVIETELTRADVASLRVRCLDVIVYDPSWEVGMAVTMTSSSALARSTAAGDVYLVEYSDTGTRSGPRPQIAFVSQRSALRIWAEGASPFELRFAVDERGVPDASREIGAQSPRARELRATQAPHARWRVAADLQSSGGNLPFTERTCELALFPDDLQSQLTCRTQLRCGETIVYGAGTSGYMRCETVVEGAQAFPRANDTGVTSEDGDPSAQLEMAQRTLRVADATATGAWEASFALRDSPSCNFEGTWTGTLDDASLRVATAEGATRVVGALVGEATAELRCPNGEAALVVDGRRFEGRFGPDFASFLAVDAEGSPLTLLRVAP
jgi:hypothetical protein